MPISRKRIVQAGPKTQLGGLKDGLASDAYQPLIAGAVNIDPITPANSHNMIAIASLIYKLYKKAKTACLDVTKDKPFQYLNAFLRLSISLVPKFFRVD